FFPVHDHTEALCTTGDEYDVAALPPSGFTTLPSNSFDDKLNSEDDNSGLGTPTEGAIRGIARFTEANRRGGRVTIGILVTDGDPKNCDEDLDHLAKLLADHQTATKVRTYVIGMEGASFDKLETLAKGGDGPEHPDTIGSITDACGNGAGPCRHWNVGNG